MPSSIRCSGGSLGRLAPSTAGIMLEAPAQELDRAVLKIVVSGMVAFRCGK